MLPGWTVTAVGCRSTCLPDECTADERMTVAAARWLADGDVIGDGELADTADTVVSVPEIFNYWLQAGRIDVGFLSAAQIDLHASLDTTVIGPYDSPQVRLPVVLDALRSMAR